MRGIIDPVRVTAHDSREAPGNAALNPEVEAARQVVARAAHDPAAHYGLAQALDRAGDAAAAIESLAHALRLAPGFAEAHNLMGILLAGRGDALGAIASFRRAIDARPGYARAHNNLGNSLRAIGETVEAERAIAEAVRLAPEYQLAQHNLGALRQALGKSDDAVVALNASLKLNAGFRPSWVALAAVERQRGNLDAAIAAYRQAIALSPKEASDERIGLAETLAECGFHDAAQRTYAEALETKPNFLAAAIGVHLGLPQVYADNNAIDVARARFATGLNELERDFGLLHEALDANATLDAWRWSNFFLAYQGRDDRELQRRYARLLARAIDAKAPELRQPAAPPRTSDAGRVRLRVGFASRFFVDGTVGQYFSRWITDLDRSAFEIFVYHLAPYADPLTERIRARADRFIHPRGVAAAIPSLARAIRADALDVLIYPEVGMDARIVVLSAMRLAPVQCAAWGHPVTTGSDAIDYFLSVAAMEPPDGNAQYVETLVRLPGIGTSYPRPAPRAASPAAMSAAQRIQARATLREKLGVSATTPVYLCSQSLFKILPDDDALFARALAAVPDAVLLLFEGAHREVSAQTMRRLGSTLASRGIAARERVRMLSRMARQDFLYVNAACDALLDTQHWSGGNTTLDALASGLPVVTLPGNLMRARQSAGMLSMAGVPELIAATPDEYVALAARLGSDPGFRQAMSQRIEAGGDRLFDDPAPLAALAAFIRDAHSRAPRSEPASSGG